MSPNTNSFPLTHLKISKEYIPEVSSREYQSFRLLEMMLSEYLMSD